MMRSFVLVVALAFPVLIQAQSKMSISMNGQLVGHGTMRVVMDSAGRLHHTMDTTIQMGEMKRTMHDESLDDKRGRPISEVEVDTFAGRKIKIDIVTGPKTMTITIVANGQTNVTKVQIPKGNIEDPSEFWFVSKRPKIGETASFLHYNIQSAKWQTRTTKYVGDEMVPGTKLKGHHILQADGSLWIDDRGNPMRIDQKTENGISLVAVRE